MIPCWRTPDSPPFPLLPPPRLPQPPSKYRYAAAAAVTVRPSPIPCRSTGGGRCWLAGVAAGWARPTGRGRVLTSAGGLSPRPWIRHQKELYFHLSLRGGPRAFGLAIGQALCGRRTAGIHSSIWKAWNPLLPCCRLQTTHFAGMEDQSQQLSRRRTGVVRKAGATSTKLLSQLLWVPMGALASFIAVLAWLEQATSVGLGMAAGIGLGLLRAVVGPHSVFAQPRRLTDGTTQTEERERQPSKAAPSTAAASKGGGPETAAAGGQPGTLARLKQQAEPRPQHPGLAPVAAGGLTGPHEEAPPVKEEGEEEEAGSPNGLQAPTTPPRPVLELRAPPPIIRQVSRHGLSAWGWVFVGGGVGLGGPPTMTRQVSRGGRVGEVWRRRPNPPSLKMLAGMV